MRTRSHHAACLCLGAFLAAGALGAEPRDGTWPQSLDQLELVWRLELGPGYPGPIVAPDRVFVAETVDGKTEVVRALDRETGESLWHHEVPNFRGMNILTPVASRDGVFTSSHRNQSYFYEVTRQGQAFAVREA